MFKYKKLNRVVIIGAIIALGCELKASALSFNLSYDPNSGATVLGTKKRLKIDNTI